MQSIILVVLSFLLIYLPLDFGGHTFMAESVLLILAFISYAGYLATKTSRCAQNIKNLFLLFLLFFAVLIVSLFYSTCFYASFIEILLLIAYFLVFIMVAAAYENSYYGKFTVILAFSVIMISLFGLYFYKITNLAGFDSDLYSTFYQKNICAGFFILTLPVILNIFLTQDDKSKYLYFGIASYLGLLSLLFTQSRWSWLIFIFSFLFIIFISHKNSADKKLFFKKLIILLLLFLFSIQIFSVKKSQGEKVIPPFVKERVSTIIQLQDSSKSARLEFYLIALKMFKDHPFAGIGAGNFGLYYAKYEKDSRYYSKFVHNFYLQVLCEYGIFGFIFFMFILFLIIREYFKALNLSRNTKYFPIISGLIIGCFGALVHIMVHLDWFFSAPPFYFWAFTGIVFYYADFLKNKTREQNENFDNKPKPYYYLAALILVILSVIIIRFYFAYNFAEEARYYKNKGELMQAFNCYKKAIKLNYLNPDYHRDIASLYFYNNRADEKNLSSGVSFDPVISLDSAIEEAKIAVKLEKMRPNNYILLAKLYKAQRNDKLYLETLNDVLQIDPINYPSIYNDLAIYYMEKNDIKKCREYVLRIIPLYKDEYFGVMTDVRRPEMKKQISDTYVLLASSDSLENNNKSAKKYLLKALDLYNDNFSANFALGMIYYNEGEYSKALEYLEKAAKLDPSIKQINDIIEKCRNKIVNSKFETRNSKQYRNTNDQNSKQTP